MVPTNPALLLTIHKPPMLLFHQHEFASAGCDLSWVLGGRHVGLWRAAVVDVEVDVRVEPRFRAPKQRGPVGAQLRMLRLLVGDGSGARSELSVPYQQR